MFKSKRAKKLFMSAFRNIDAAKREEVTRRYLEHYKMLQREIYSLLNNSKNRILFPKKKKGSSQRGSGNKVPSHLNDSPFAVSIPQKSDFDNSFDKKTSKNADSGRRSALKKVPSATRSDVKAVREELLEAGVNPRFIVDYANDQYGAYGGEDTKTGLQHKLLQMT